MAIPAFNRSEWFGHSEQLVEQKQETNGWKLEVFYFTTISADFQSVQTFLTVEM